jgi:hypothetical protein
MKHWRGEDGEIMALYLNTADKKITSNGNTLRGTRGNTLRGSVPMSVKLGTPRAKTPAAWAKYGDKEKTAFQSF